jgi:hypothetical protein
MLQRKWDEWLVTGMAVRAKILLLIVSHPSHPRYDMIYS